MRPWLYNKGMTWFIPLINIILPLIKDSKIITIVVLMTGAGALGYAQVNDRHTEAMNKIGANQIKINSLEKQNIRVIEALKSITASMTNIKTTVDKTDERLWEISRSINKLKK